VCMWNMLAYAIGSSAADRIPALQCLRCVLNRDTLSIAMASRADVVASRAIYNPAKNYRKAVYRQWIMWQPGPGVRQVVPSCVVWAVRGTYPTPDSRSTDNKTTCTFYTNLEM